MKARIKARAEGEANAILLVLRRRGIDLDQAQTQRILDCGDPSRLDNWLLRAVTAESASDVLDDEDDTEEASDPEGKPQSV